MGETPNSALRRDGEKNMAAENGRRERARQKAYDRLKRQQPAAENES